jgi:UDP-glucose:(heptosyl)LPS alpha-1,3-glucosyltransferase
VFAQQIEHQWTGVTYHRLWTPLVRPRWINQLWFAVTSWLATRKGFDVVHSHESTWHGQVQTVHVLPVKHNLFYGRVGWQRALRWVKVIASPRLMAYLWLEKLRYAPEPGRRVVVTSPSLGAIMAQTFPESAPMLGVLVPGIAQVKRPMVGAQQAARQTLGLPTEGRCVLFVANDYRKKGLPALMEALSLLPPDSFLAVVGNGTHIPVFRAQAKALSLAPRMFFLGSLTDMRVAYAAADCLAHPTLEDTFAMVVLEAMAHGVPVVVSCARFCGISGLLQDRVQALILEDPKDVTNLAKLIGQTLSNPVLRKELIDAGLVFAESYLWSEIALQQEQMYFSVLSKVT